MCDGLDQVNQVIGKGVIVVDEEDAGFKVQGSKLKVQGLDDPITGCRDDDIVIVIIQGSSK
jgi:hypothetical protein